MFITQSPAEINIVNAQMFHSGFPLQDLVLGASLYFPPMFKAFLLGLVFWLLIHRVLRDWIYSGEVWHPTLMDLSLFVISICAALMLMVNL
ncbi:hypothetical protein GRAQ_01847 [Rahnella aquatilis CIP 78.65 = ATCC 33071]|nr:hypothetical protein GRAQ_01847 [Rahnella aquatilis CIP 78.65 = ATCC 33071]